METLYHELFDAYQSPNNYFFENDYCITHLKLLLDNNTFNFQGIEIIPALLDGVSILLCSFPDKPYLIFRKEEITDLAAFKMISQLPSTLQYFITLLSPSQLDEIDNLKLALKIFVQKNKVAKMPVLKKSGLKFSRFS